MLLTSGEINLTRHQGLNSLSGLMARGGINFKKLAIQ